MQEAIKNFLFHCEVEKKLNDKTLKAYQIDLRQFESFLLSERVWYLESIGKEEIRSYLHGLSGFAPKTIKRKTATAKAFFNYHEFEESIINNPFRKVKSSVKIPVQLPKVMTLDQVGSMLAIAYSDKENERSVHRYVYAEKIRDVAVLELLFATGIRVSELCCLRLENMASDYSTIMVEGKGNKERIIPIPNQEVKMALDAYYKEFKSVIGEYFFVNRLKKRLSTQSVRYMVRQYRKKANISMNVTPHVFRHSFATLLLEQDVDIRYIQSILGHSSISTTQIYTHVNSKKKSEILAQKHPRNMVSF